MKPSSFLSLYDKLEKLVSKLPEPLQQPILREIRPIKTLFLLQRAPRLVLLGENGVGKAEVLNALFGSEIMPPGEDTAGDGAWQEFGRSARGTLRLLDARRATPINAVKLALTAEAPDLFLFVRAAKSKTLVADLDHAEKLITFATGQHPENRARLLAAIVPSAKTDSENARQDLHSALHARTELSARMIATLTLSPEETQRLAEQVAIELPGEAQLEIARLSGNRVLQKQIAQVVTKSVTAICGAIGAQPIPLADFPILTSLQATMVAGIMHISGREMSARLAGEFIAALGANVGVGLALREGSRAVVKLIPVWGNAISGAVAAAGTYSIGRAATAYFIEGIPLPDARALFRKRRKDAKTETLLPQ